jgi:hypothetical protein
MTFRLKTLFYGLTFRGFRVIIGLIFGGIIISEAISLLWKV